MTGLLVTFDPEHPEHTWEKITDSGYIRNHDPHGDTLYVVDIGVRPSFRKWGLGKQLMQAMYEVVVELRLERLLGGGRRSGYHRHAEQISAKTYLARVVAGKLKDPVITFLLRCGRMPIGVVANYLEDEESCNYAALMEWKNPFYKERKVK
jgi:GNAT superfamily N-acetyltransferase